MGEGRGIYSVLVGKPEGKRPLGRPRCSWEDNIKMDLQEVGCGSPQLASFIHSFLYFLHIQKTKYVEMVVVVVKNLSKLQIFLH
jgi:hypothetical protein